MIDRALRAVGHRTDAGPTGRAECPPEWYDLMYSRSRAYKDDPEAVSWLPIWQAALREIPRSPVVVDLGCGVGQFAELLARRRPDVRSYMGYDFSVEAIKYAWGRDLGPAFKFARRHIGSVYIPRGAVTVCLEVMEHLEDDALPIRQTPVGNRFVGSVPNYDSASHVRTYDEAAVRARFGAWLGDLRVSEVPVARWKKAYVFTGIRQRKAR